MRRDDAAYVGMIGSKTKRATFKNWLSREIGRPELFDRLICPIGGTAVKDKRPAVIAAACGGGDHDGGVEATRLRQKPAAVMQSALSH